MMSLLNSELISTSIVTSTETSNVNSFSLVTSTQTSEVLSAYESFIGSQPGSQVTASTTVSQNTQQSMATSSSPTIQNSES